MAQKLSESKATSSATATNANAFNAGSQTAAYLVSIWLSEYFVDFVNTVACRHMASPAFLTMLRLAGKPTGLQYQLTCQSDAENSKIQCDWLRYSIIRLAQVRHFHLTLYSY
jgi:hypothetical protein